MLLHALRRQQDMNSLHYGISPLKVLPLEGSLPHFLHPPCWSAGKMLVQTWVLNIKNSHVICIRNSALGIHLGTRNLVLTIPTTLKIGPCSCISPRDFHSKSSQHVEELMLLLSYKINENRKQSAFLCRPHTAEFWTLTVFSRLLWVCNFASCFICLFANIN